VFSERRKPTVENRLEIEKPLKEHTKAWSKDKKAIGGGSN
jgi:hypothetical protein